VVIDLPTAYVGPRSAAARPARRDGPGLSTAPLALADGRTKATRVCRRRLRAAAAFRQPPQGCACRPARPAAENFISAPPTRP
jgi:hypothetical protein